MNDRSASHLKARKSRRNPRACDACHRRNVKCERSEVDSSRCQHCADFGDTCTFDRPMRKRGAKPKSHANNVNQSPQTSNNEEPPPVALSPKTVAKASPDAPDLPTVDSSSSRVPNNATLPKWSPRMVAPQSIIMDLTGVYLEVVYPIIPCFHRPNLLQRVSDGAYLTDRPFYASIMAMCALASARARAGALYSNKWNLDMILQFPAEDFMKAADDALPKDDRYSSKFDHMRACVLLSIYSLQCGDLSGMSLYLGIYNIMLTVGEQHDEANWPANIGIVEREERRRLIWATYTLDIFTSIIWSRSILSREGAFNVCYPTETDDESFSDAGYSAEAPYQKSHGCSWLKGWNFIIDIYRILEHAVDILRCSRFITVRSPSVQAFFPDKLPSQRALFKHIMGLYDALPAPFKTTRPMTCNLTEDLFSFQAASIAATIQLFRMVHFTNDHSTLEQKCQVASEVIAGFAAVPVDYIRAMGSPLLHHLAAIGTILGAAFEDGLSETTYGNIRAVLLALANLLANLEVDLFCPSGASDKLRAQVSRIDAFMNTQRMWMTTQFQGQPQVQTQQQNPHQQQVAGMSTAVAAVDSGGIASQQGVSAAASGGVHDQGQIQAFAGQGPLNQNMQFRFPPELLEDWSWAFNFTSTGG